MVDHRQSFELIKSTEVGERVAYNSTTFPYSLRSELVTPEARSSSAIQRGILRGLESTNDLRLVGDYSFSRTMELTL